MKKLSQEEFINRSSQIHDNYYDYSLVEYKSVDTKVKIICPEHGIFEQRCDHHLSGRKCKICSTKSEKHLENKNTYNLAFLIKAREKWDNKYDYSLVEYTNAKTKVKIICPVHGIFEQTPDSHLKCECLKCSIIINANKQRKTLEEFIKQANKIHNNYYSYNYTIYINDKTKVEILCPEHGMFLQQPNNHLWGKRCPSCSNTSKGEKKIEEILIKNNIEYIREKTFDDLKNPLTNTKLRIDFYLPKYNKSIEYDGIQHFKVVSIWGDEKTLEDNIYKDRIKNQYCIDKNISLLRINYKIKLSKIEDIILSFLPNHL